MQTAFTSNGAFRPLRLVLSIAALSLLAGHAAQAAGPDKIQIGDAANIFPESMAVASDGTLYAGSNQLGIVFKADPGADKATAWIQAPTSGPHNMLGVLADEKSGALYVCYVDPTNRRGGDGQPAVLAAYDLKTGASKANYTFLSKSYCNDASVGPDGVVYASDTSGGRIMRLKPGAAALDNWFADPKLVGIDGIAFGKGALYVTNVDKNLLYRVDLNADGSAKGLTELKTSQPVQGPDGMRFGENGVLYLAENKAGQVDELDIDGDSITVKPIKNGFQTPTAVNQVGNALWVGEAKFGQKQPGNFYAYKIDLSGK